MEYESIFPTDDPEDQAQAEAQERKARQRVSERFRVEHGLRSKAILEDLKHPGGNIRLLEKLASEEAALHQRLIELQLQLAERAIVTVDKTAVTKALAASMKSLAPSASAISQRVESLLLAAASLRAAQQGNARKSHLRSVA